jgi:hypothetical protein
MAIVRNLEVGSILWKYETTIKQPVRDPERAWSYLRDERGRTVYEEVPQYRAIKLYNRRCRNSGCVIKEELVPFFEKLKVKIWRPYQGSRPTAVGCEDYVVATKEEWDAIVLDEVADRYYKRIKNVELKSMIKLEEGEIPARPIEELKSLDLSDRPEEDDWPEEPQFSDQTPWYIRSGTFTNY